MVDFSDKFIAYVDILGFKGLVADAEQGKGLALDDLLKLLGLLGTGKERARFDQHGPACCPYAPRIEKNLDFRVTQISDCVVVSAEVSPAGVINVISHCWGAVIELLARGLMCRGYIKRGNLFHSDTQIIGSGYQEAFLAESMVSAFKREADERGTPYVEVDAEINDYVLSQSDHCAKEMYERMIKRDGDTVVIFPFRRLQHSFIVAGFNVKFDPERERVSNQNLRMNIQRIKERIWSFVDRSVPNAVSKANHYIAALDAQLQVCDKTDEFIHNFESQM